MSNRTEAEVTYAAELKAAHLAQIEALTAPGLTRMERVERFMQAARFDCDQRRAIRYIARDRPQYPDDFPPSPARVVWIEGGAPWSLFANLPGCHCPVMEVARGGQIAGIPATIPVDWSPTAEELQPFARIQQERRIRE